MNDSRLRALERAFQESGSSEDEIAYLREVVRTGGLPQGKLLAAAISGDEIARTALGPTLFTVFSEKEKWKLQKRWRETFARHVMLATGKWVYQKLDWRAFDQRESFPAFNTEISEFFAGKQARARFSEVESKDWIVLPDSPRRAAFQTQQDPRRVLASVPGILLVTNSAFAWTMVFPREGKLSGGPFFAVPNPDSRGTVCS